MASRRLSLINALCTWVVRPHLSRTPTPAKAHRDLELAARFALRAPPHTLVREDGDLSWISVGDCDPRHVILYLHGGGYIAGSPRSHAAMLGRLSKLSGLRVAALDYPRAPEHGAPAQFNAAVTAYARLLDTGFAPAEIVVGGDSAGGGLALSLVAHLCQTDQRPAGVFVFSPWTDLTLTGSSIASNAANDRLLDAARMEELVGYVAPNLPADDPRVSPLFADFPDPPPTLIHVSQTEILLEDARRMAARLRDAGAQVTLFEHPDAPHVWPLFDGYFPEARESLGAAAEFCKNVLSSQPSS